MSCDSQLPAVFFGSRRSKLHRETEFDILIIFITKIYYSLLPFTISCFDSSRYIPSTTKKRPSGWKLAYVQYISNLTFYKSVHDLLTN